MSLNNDYMRDLITDIRCAKRDNLPEYEAECRAKLKALWPKRHFCKQDKYGMPKIGENLKR